MRPIDLAVVALYLAAITWFGARFRRSQHTLARLLPGRPQHALVGHRLLHRFRRNQHADRHRHAGAGLSRNFGFLQVVLGYLLARIVISTLFLPHYFRGEMFTAYELMQRRFGQRIRSLTAGTFLLLRALAEGVRVFAISIVVSIILGTGETPPSS